MIDDEVWLWNVDLAWELFSSAIYNYRLSLNEQKTHKKHAYHKNVILNTVTAVEAYCNKILSKEENWSESKLNKTSLNKKLVELGIEAKQTEFDKSKDIRNNFIIHHKRRDYSYFRKINESTALDAIESSQDLIAAISFNRGAIFPYWITGLNYINPRHGNDIFLLNNNQFWMDLRSLQVSEAICDMTDATGAINPPKDRKTYDSLHKEIWNELKDRRFKLDEVLKNLKTPKFPHKPLLTSEWWNDL
ncbi:hypothetical protein KAR91_70210 [Candidatus Pacearchaeota archaeon]|nr:hypothetical protein [Candidatus Pacearchaeota archaeon]